MVRSFVRRHFVVLGLSLLACRADTLEPDLPSTPLGRPQFSVTMKSDTLLPVADAYLRSAAANQNRGTDDSTVTRVTVGSNDTTRAILRFDQAAIAARVGSGTLVTAKLELTIKASGSTAGGNDVAIHRMTMPWVEIRATWNCGEDTKPNNQNIDCTTTRWAMAGSGPIPNPFALTPTTQVHLGPAQTGVVQFDVTADVAAFLSGTSNQGWLLKIASESQSQQVSYWSREATAKPRLILAVDTGWTRLNGTLPVFDTTKTVTIPGGTFQLYRTEARIRFEPGVSDSAQAAFFERRGLIVLGVDPKHLFDRNPNLLVVVSAGNERFRGTPEAYMRADTAAAVRAALLLLTREATYRDRIVVVAGTTQGNQFWDTWSSDPNFGSNFFEGATDIAAPAQDISVLDRRTDSSSPVTVQSGTSLSAPLVAGVAAQLIAMDPALTPAMVKHYLVQGAQEPRRDPSSAAEAAPNAIANAPDALYQLDAFGSLAKLSRERTGVPICGYTIAAGHPGSVRLEKGPGAGDTLIVPVPQLSSAHRIARTSVAPGGRLVTLFEQADTITGASGTLSLSHLGQRLSFEANLLWRENVERHVLKLDFYNDAGIARLRIHVLTYGGAFVRTVDLTFPSGQRVPFVLTQPLAISPTGEYVAFRYGPDLYSMPLDGRPSQHVAALPVCQPDCTREDHAFSHNGRQLVSAIAIRDQGSGVFTTHVYAYAVTSTGGTIMTNQQQALVLPGTDWTQLNFTSDDARVFGLQQVTGQYVERAAGDLAVATRSINVGTDLWLDRMSPLRRSSIDGVYKLSQ